MMRGGFGVWPAVVLTGLALAYVLLGIRHRHNTADALFLFGVAVILLGHVWYIVRGRANTPEGEQA